METIYRLSIIIIFFEASSAMGEIISIISMRPISFFIILTIGVLLVPSIVIPFWYQLKNMEIIIKRQAYYGHNQLVSRIVDIVKFVLPIDSLANDITDHLTSVLEINKQLSFSEIQTKVYALAFPSKGLMLGNMQDVYMHVIILMMVAIMVISIFAFVSLMVRATRREVHLCAAYMKQMEKTSQAERKSMKQSLAFASANHDVRGYLACIKGLIDLSSNHVSPSSELASNLRKMNACVEDLLALVSSILDYSKIEAGKMQLEEKEFNLAQLLEDIADLHHPVAMKKGVEVILDPCDGSIMKYGRVKGDQGKLKQILSNLLSNAVKFTSQGHIIVRAWVKKKPSLENSIIASNNKSCLLNRLSRLFYKNKRAYDEVEERRTIKQDPNCMEFEFEVEDTGLGIPKDKRESIFENFVQVKENSVGQIGTGLGLGIVQSLVRLMGGDIEIMDKTNGEKGSCFKFNIFLISEDLNKEDLNNPREDKAVCTDTSSRFKLNSFTILGSGVEGSIVVLLIKNDERRKTVHRYIERLGINLVVVTQASKLSQALKRKLDFSIPFRKIDGVDDFFPSYKKANSQRSVECVLLIIDANAGDFHELCRSVAEFRKDQCRTVIKVVWLEKPENRKVHFPGLEDDSLPSTDCIISEPFHGSRLIRVIGYLPEFGGAVPSVSLLTYSDDIDTKEVASTSSTDQQLSLRKRKSQFESNDDAQNHESVNIGSSNSSKELCERPLTGKKILVAGNGELMRDSSSLLKNLGGVVEIHQNGRNAVEIVVKALQDQNPTPSNIPYDYIFMETEMEVTNGYDATKLIRDEERKYGVHIPIIALVHKPSNEERQRIIQVGMDFVLISPYTNDSIMQAIRSVEKKYSSITPEREEQNTDGCGASSKLPLEGRKFLIVEDLLMLRKVTQNFLSRSGASVELCENGKEAVDLISKALSLTSQDYSQFPYDFVLMDCQMPVMDGFEATRRIRNEEKKYNIHIPIIALTSDEGAGEQKKITDAGMDFHLTKPLKIQELLKTMKRINIVKI